LIFQGLLVAFFFTLNYVDAQFTASVLTTKCR